MPIDDYDSFVFELSTQDDPEYPGERSKPVFHRGKKGDPGVLIMHELPGLAPQTFELGDRIAEKGYQVFIPVLFGNVLSGRSPSLHLLKSLPKLWCVRREFLFLEANVQRPITNWLRALCRDIHRQCGGPGVGAIGMCLTGGFVISLLVDETMLAGIAAEPSLPLHQFTLNAARREAKKAELGVAPAELREAKKRTTAGKAKLLGACFEGDDKCTPKRFATLQQEFGPGFKPVMIPLSSYEKHGIRKQAHSVLTYDFCDKEGHPTKEALQEVLTLLDDQLK